MKKLFVSLVALTMATMSYAQSNLVATLSHEGEVSVFHGAGALGQSLEAADDGDIITLSTGQFNAVDINKAITLRGAGISTSNDSINLQGATIIQGTFTINQADTQEGRIIMEGLYFSQDIKYSGTLKDAQFSKCRFKSFKATTDAIIVNSYFIHCRFYNGYSQNANSNTYFINCAICNPMSKSTTSSIEFKNCFVKFDASGGYYSEHYSGSQPYDVISSYYNNSIIQQSGNWGRASIPSSCTVYSCVCLGNSNLFKDILITNDKNKYASIPIFKSYDKTNYADYDTYIQDTYSFELTDEAAATYLGTDGTQVGIYGSNLPWDVHVISPQITKCNVASKTTADGKLSVEIEVKAAE